MGARHPGARGGGFVLTWGRTPGNLVLALAAVVLVGAVLAAVHHAEVALVVTLMVTADQAIAGLARDTVFTAVMISVNGIVGLSLLVGALRHNLAVFDPAGTGSGLATVVPRFTTSEAASVSLYAMFVFTPDRAAPRLLPAGRGRRDRCGRGPRRPCRPSRGA